MGTVTLTTSSSCSLDGASTAGSLLDGSGRKLPVGVVPTGTTTLNPPGGPWAVTVRPHAGTGDAATILFNWRAPYCGPRPGALRLTLVSGPNAARDSVLPELLTVRVPLDGPDPVCTGDHGSTGPLLLGFVDRAARVGQPLPQDRKGLRVSVGVPAYVPAAPAPVAFGYAIRLINPTASPIALAPCPGYLLQVVGTVYAGPPNPPGETLTGPATRTGRLNCAASPPSVPAHGSVTFDMRFGLSSGVGAGFQVVPGQTFHLSWAMAGAPTAAASIDIP